MSLHPCFQPAPRQCPPEPAPRQRPPRAHSLTAPSRACSLTAPSRACSLKCPLLQSALKCPCRPPEHPQVPASPERPPDFLDFPKNFFFGGGGGGGHMPMAKPARATVDPLRSPKSPDPPWPPETPDPPWPPESPVSSPLPSAAPPWYRHPRGGDLSHVCSC